MEPRRRYIQEFKQEAIQQTKLVGGAITQVEKDLGFKAAMLGPWCREANRRERKAFPEKEKDHGRWERYRLKKIPRLVNMSLWISHPESLI